MVRHLVLKTSLFVFLRACKVSDRSHSVSDAHMLLPRHQLAASSVGVVGISKVGITLINRLFCTPGNFSAFQCLIDRRSAPMCATVKHGHSDKADRSTPRVLPCQSLKSRFNVTTAIIALHVFTLSSSAVRCRILLSVHEEASLRLYKSFTASFPAKVSLNLLHRVHDAASCLPDLHWLPPADLRSAPRSKGVHLSYPGQMMRDRAVDLDEATSPQRRNHPTWPFGIRHCRDAFHL